MIARAAEGSVRDGLSLLDQAIAYGEGKVKAADVAAMLGLMDRSRIIDLFEAVMEGDAKAAIEEIERQYQERRRPRDHPQRPCRLCALGHPPQGGEGTAPWRTAPAPKPRRRAARTCGTCAMAHLTRAWSMLLKGIREAELHSEPLMAAEMVLIRLPMPPTFRAARTGEDCEAGAARRRVVPISARELLRGGPEASGGGAGGPCRQAAGSAPQRPTETRAFSSLQDLIRWRTNATSSSSPNLKALSAPSAWRPAIEIALEPAPARAFPVNRAQARSLDGLRWMVMVAKEGGEKPVCRQRQESRDSLFSWRATPGGAGGLKRFPGAEIINVKEPTTVLPQHE